MTNSAQYISRYRAIYHLFENELDKHLKIYYNLLMLSCVLRRRQQPDCQRCKHSSAGTVNYPNSIFFPVIKRGIMGIFKRKKTGFF